MSIQLLFSFLKCLDVLKKWMKGLGWLKEGKCKKSNSVKNLKIRQINAIFVCKKYKVQLKGKYMFELLPLILFGILQF